MRVTASRYADWRDHSTALLLIASANLAAVSASRFEDRRPELSLRSALGAGKGRLVRQLGLESLLLAMTGGVAGIGLAHLALPAVPGILPATVPFLTDPVVDLRVGALGLALSLLAGMLVGAWPVWRLLREPPAPRGVRVRGRSRVYSTIVVALFRGSRRRDRRWPRLQGAGHAGPAGCCHGQRGLRPRARWPRVGPNAHPPNPAPHLGRGSGGPLRDRQCGRQRAMCLSTRSRIRSPRQRSERCRGLVLESSGPVCSSPSLLDGCPRACPVKAPGSPAPARVNGPTTRVT
ncbi:MAG: FtsX-like permease family protein [Acidobacteriota bacterium]